MNRIRFSCFALLAAAAVACNKDDIITREEAQAPVIAFDVNTGVYTAKVGREFTIAPTYEYVDRAVYAWKLEKTGRIISTEPVLTYVIDEVEGEEKEDYYIELEVTTPQGTTREQTRVEVYRILPPVIVLSEGAEVVRGHVYEISPDVRWGEKATYRWTMRRPGAAEAEEVGREQTYEFCEQALGEYELRLRAENEDGADEKSIRVEVTEALPVSVTVPPIGRLYDGLTRTVPLGRSITLRPSIWNGRNPRYSWTVDGEEISTELACTYTPSGKGVKKLLFTVTDSSDEPAAAVAKGVRSTGEVRATVEYSVECCDEEGAFRRPATPPAKCRGRRSTNIRLRPANSSMNSFREGSPVRRLRPKRPSPMPKNGCARGRGYRSAAGAATSSSGSTTASTIRRRVIAAATISRLRATPSKDRPNRASSG